ncbi:MAG: ferredoxin [Protaetiibacter sp.]
MLDITVHRDACIGAGQCALVAGDIFDQDDDGIVLLLTEHPADDQAATAARAAALCPARAIAVTER